MQELSHQIKLQDKEYFGCSISVCDDGSKFVIGARGGSPTDPVSNGAAYVFEDDIVTKLEAPDGKFGDRFGVSCKMSGDGSTVAIGAYHANAVYVFKDNVFCYKLEANAKYFGYNIDIDHTGSKVLVGAYNYKGCQGKAFYYEEDKLVDSFQAYDTKQNDFFGRTVKLSSDGCLAWIGTRNHEKVYEFEYQSIWIQKKTHYGIYNPRQKNIKERHGHTVSGSFLEHESWFGYAIDIFPDGTALIGAPRHNGHGAVFYVK